MLERENIELVCCPTEMIIVDYYTKPLRGSLFRKIRDILMGHAPFPDEECVRLSTKVNENVKTSETSGEGVSREPVPIREGEKSVTYAGTARTGIRE